MKPIDADKLKERLSARYSYKNINPVSASFLSMFLELIDTEPAISQPPNEPLTLEELREMAWKQPPVWCRDADGIHAGLLCIRDDWYTSERTPHIWILDEEGNSGVYSVQSLIQAGATFYRRRPEEGTA